MHACRMHVCIFVMNIQSNVSIISIRRSLAQHRQVVGGAPMNWVRAGKAGVRRIVLEAKQLVQVGDLAQCFVWVRIRARNLRCPCVPNLQRDILRCEYSTNSRSTGKQSKTCSEMKLPQRQKSCVPLGGITVPTAG